MNLEGRPYTGSVKTCPKHHHRDAQVRFTDHALAVDFQDGRSLSVPLDWFPKLRDASPEQQADHRLIGTGIGIHWESLGIDLSTQGLLLDSPPTQDGEYTRPKRASYHVVPAVFTPLRE